MDKQEQYKEFCAKLPHSPVFYIDFMNEEGNYLNSKIGGDFYWPDENPPERRFLAQINFSELPENDIFPKTGMLQFFVGTDDSYGFFDKKAGSLVVYHKTAEKGHKCNRSYRDSPILKNSRMSFRFSEECMSIYDFRYREYGKEYLEPDDDLYKMICGDGSKLLGYPFFTQEDPRYNNKYPIMLLQLDSDQKHLMWGDCGVANFFIGEKALKNMDFSDVLYYWDCY